MKTRVKLWQDSDYAPPELLEKIKARRHQGQLIALDRLLLNSFPLAEGWNEYLRRIRQDLSLPGDLRELLICRVAQLNDAAYEWSQHIVVYLKEGGTQDKADAMRNWETNAIFNDAERALLSLTDYSTLKVKVPDSVFVELRKHFSEQHIVEAVGVVACYNMVSRFLVALELENIDLDKNP